MKKLNIKRKRTAAVLLLTAISMAPALSAFGSNESNGKQGKQTTQLGSMTVTGSQIRALKMIKVALKTPRSTSAKDRDVMVCSLVQKTGTHLKRIACATNAAWNKREDSFHTAWFLASAGSGGLSLQHLAAALDSRSPTGGFAVFSDTSRIMAALKQLPAIPKDAAVKVVPK